jgi:hypothetical protein
MLDGNDPIGNWVTTQWKLFIAHGVATWTGRIATVTVGTYRFVITPRGTTYKVPRNWVARTADNGKGIVYQDPSSIGKGNGNENMIRIMEPTAMYPNGYSRLYNKYGQPVDINGNPGPNPDTHFPEDGPGDLPDPPIG